MRTGGFVFPQTVLEVEAFERKFGTTDINLPEGLEFPTFLDAKGLKGSESKIFYNYGKPRFE
jgi:hypothetical protein